MLSPKRLVSMQEHAENTIKHTIKYSGGPYGTGIVDAQSVIQLVTEVNRLNGKLNRALGKIPA